jgi:hypothetical protein
MTMSQHDHVRTVHVITGQRWKDAIFSLLEPRSPLRRLLERINKQISTIAAR